MRVSLAATMFAFSALLAGAANAGVDVTKITRGNVSFSQDGNRLVVRASNGSIIEYNRFSVEAGQIMQFIQPSSTSRVLNRVTGAELSRIDGSLLSNGIVYLVNPQGIRIGNGALINVGGFYAAAGAMSDNDFIRGQNNFTNLSGKVINEGMIQAQSVALVGQYVANHGTINVDDGMVAMAAGDTVFLQNGPSPFMVTVNRSAMGADGSGAGTEAAVTNTGTINAGKGRVSMGSGDFYALGMNLSGTIIGKSIAARSGKGSVLAVNGTLDASDSAGKGGDIDVFGDRVGLFGNALVNANGATGGGSVRIGGDYLGSNAENAPQANRTFINTDARVTANATQSGNGGRVIVWSNEYTGFFGSIQANGAGVGNGGFVETSSHDNLQAFGRVDAKAALGGKGGTWLMDPANVEIVANSAGALVAGVFNPGASPAFIGVDQINASLNSGTSVTINTASGTGGTGIIVLTGNISMTSAVTQSLTLNASDNIFLNGSIIASGSANLSVFLNAVNGVTMNGTITTRGGSLTISNSGAGTVAQAGLSVLTIGGTTTVTTGGAAITLGGTTNNFTGAVSLTNTGPNVVLITATNALVLGTVSMATASAGTLTVNSVGLTQFGITTITTGTGVVNMNAGAGGITLTNANQFNGPVSLNSGAAVAIKDVNALTLGTSNITQNLLVTTGAGLSVGGLTQTGALTVGGTTRLDSLAGEGSTSINLSTSANNLAGEVTLLNPGNILDFKLRNTNASAVTPTGLTSADFLRDLTIIYSVAYVVPNLDMEFLRNIEITAGGAITQEFNSSIELSGTASFTTTNFLIDLSKANNFAGAVSVSNIGISNPVSITSSFDLILGTSTVGGDLNLITGVSQQIGFGHLTQTGILTVGGNTFISTLNTFSNIDLSVRANNLGGSVTLSDPANVQDFKLRNINPAAGAVVNLDNSGTGTTKLRDLTITYNASAYVVPTLTMDTLRNIAITAGGAITQGAGGINNSTVGGTSSFTTTGFAITLRDTANDFNGVVSLTNTGANAVAITDANALTLGTLSIGGNLTTSNTGALNLGQGTVGGNLSATSTTGAITQNAGLTITGTSNINAGGAVITLNQSLNNFGGAVSLTNTGANAVRITDANALILGTSSVGSGTLTVVATGANSITQTGTITQAAGAGATSFTTGAGVITLNLLNNFTGAVSLNNTGANAVVITDTNALILGTSSVGSGALTVVATGANSITQTGTITQAAGAGATSFTTGAGVITLNLSNNFTGAVSLTNTGANAVVITDTNALILGTSSVGQNLFVTTGAEGIAGGLTQTGAITVPGTTTITSSAAVTDIDLSTQDNNLTGTVTIATPASNVRDFKLKNINEAAGVIVNLDNTLTGTTNLRDLTIDYPNAEYVLPVLTTLAVRNLSVTSCGNFILTTQTTTNDLTLSICGSVTIEGIVTVGGNLSITSATEISGTPIVQDVSSKLDISGTSEFSNQKGGGIQLVGNADSGNFFRGTVTLNNNKSGGPGLGGAINIIARGNTILLPLILGDVTMTRTIPGGDALNIFSGGAIRGSGVISSSNGAVTIEGNGNIAFTNSSNNFRGPVSIKSNVPGANIAITDSNALELGLVEMPVGGSGTLDIIAGTGGLTQLSGTTITTGLGNITINVTGGVVTLNNPNNDFNGTVILTNTGAFAVGITNGIGNEVLKFATVLTGDDFTARADAITLTSTLTTSIPNAGKVTLNATAGLLTINAGANLNTGGAVSLTGFSGILTAGNVTTNNANVDFFAPVILTDNIAINTGVGLGNIKFFGFVQGTADGTQALTLTAGTGDITFTGELGTLLINLGAITINSAKNVSAMTTINAANFRQIAGTGTTTFEGAQVYSALAGLNVKTNSITLKNTVDTAGAGVLGVVTLNADGGVGGGILTILAGADITSSGAVSLTGAGGISTGGTVDTVNGNVTMSATSQRITLFTGADITANGNVSFTANGPTGGITTDGSITTTSGGTVAMVTTGTLVISSNADIDSDGAVDLTGGLGISTAGNITTSADTVTFYSATTLISDVFIDTGTGIGSIVFESTLDGPGDLDLTAGNADISFVDDVGVLASVGVVTVKSALTTTASGSFRAQQLNLVDPGTTKFDNNLTLTDSTAGLTVSSLGGSYNIFINGETNSVGGYTEFNNTGGTVHIGRALGTTEFVKGIKATEPSLLILRGTVRCTELLADMNLGSASVQLASNTILVTNNGDIALGGTLNATGSGIRNLTLTAGTGDITFAGVVGATPLSAILITDAHDVTATNISAGSFVQQGGTGTTTFNGAQIYTAVEGLNVQTDTIALNSTVNTVNAGSIGIVTLNANNLDDVLALGTLTIASGANISSGGEVTLVGKNGIYTAGNVTTSNDNVTFTTDAPAATLLTGTVVINTGLGLGNISFVGALDGESPSGIYNLTLAAGTGTITFGGDVGTVAPLNTVTVTSASSTTANGTFKAETLDLVAPGTTVFNGNLTLNTSLTTGLGAYSVSILGGNNLVKGNTLFRSTGTLTIGQALGTTTFTDGVTATAPLQVVLNGTIATTGNIDFANASSGVSLDSNVTLRAIGEVDLNKVDGTVVHYNLNIAAADLVLGGNITNIGTLTIQNVDPMGSITLMGLGGLAIETQPEWDFIQSSVDFVVLGNTVTNEGAITVAAGWFNDRAVTVDFLRGGLGEFNVFGKILNTNLDTGSLTVHGSGNSSNINADIYQASINIFDSVVIGGTSPRTLTTSATTLGGIVIDSTDFDFGISADSVATDLILLAISPNGSISLKGQFTDFGGNALNNLTMEGNLLGTITLEASGAIEGALLVDNAANINLNTNGGTLTAGSMSFGDASNPTTTLTGDATLRSLTSFSADSIDGTSAHNNLNIAADSLVLNGDITNIGTLTIQNVDDMGSITLMGLGGLAIETQSEWDFIQSSVDFVVLGNTVTNEGAITVAAGWFNDRAVTVDFLRGGLGEFNVFGKILNTNLDTGSLTVHGSGNSSNINADITQASINILDSVVVGGTGPRVITATALGGIVIDSTTFSNGISGDGTTSLELRTTANASISLTGQFTDVGGGDLLDLTMRGFGVDADTITLAASGLIAGALSVSNASGINLNTNGSTLTAGSMLFGANTALTSTTTLVSTIADIGFGAVGETATLNGAQNLTLTAVGDILFSGAVGSSGTPLGAVTINSAATVLVSSTFTAASFRQNAGSVATTFADTLNIVGGFDFTGQDLNINSLGSNRVGDTMNVNNTGQFTIANGANLIVTTEFVQVGAGRNLIGGNITTTDGVISFISQVNLTGDVLMNTVSVGGGNNIIFNDTVDGTHALGLNAGLGSITFGNNVGLNEDLASLTVTSADFTMCFGDIIKTVGDQTYNSGVQINAATVAFTATDTNGDITFNGAIRSANGFENATVSAGGNVTFNNTVGGTDATTQLGTLTVDCGNTFGKTITFGAAAATVRAVAVNLNTNTLLARPATVATIVARSNITFSNTTFAMGRNEKLTSLGNITIGGLTTANATSVSLGDVNAVGNLRVTSSKISLLARASGPIITNTGGTLTDPMVDYIVGGQVFFSTAPVMSGSGGRAIFSSPTGHVDGSGTLTNFTQTLYLTPITVALLTGLDGQVLDLSVISSAFKYGNPANIIPQAMASLPSLGLLGGSETLDSEEATALKAKKAKKDANTAAAKAKKSASSKPAAAAPVPVASR